MAGAFLTIIDTTYARQFPPTHQQDDGACFNFFPRALTGTKQQQLREVCGSTLKSCHREKKRKEKKTADLTFWKKKRRITFQPYCKAIF